MPAGQESRVYLANGWKWWAERINTSRRLPLEGPSGGTYWLHFTSHDDIKQLWWALDKTLLDVTTISDLMVMNRKQILEWHDKAIKARIIATARAAKEEAMA